MNCSKVEELEDSYLLGELEEKEAAVMKQHIAGCPDCANRLAANQEILGQLFASVEPISPPPRARTALLEKISNVPPAALLSLPPPRRNWVNWAMGVAAALIIGLGLWVFSLQSSLNEVSSHQLEAQRLADYTSAADTRVWTMITSEQDRTNPNAPRARMYIRDGSDYYYVTTSKIPPAPSGKNYKLWMVRGDNNPTNQPEFVSNLAPDNQGRITVQLANPSRSANITSCFITIEGGEAGKPTAPVYLIWSQS